MTEAVTPEHLPHVVAWNLTRRCNLACAHCYISAGSWQGTGTDLTTAEVRRIMDEILAMAGAPLFILSGGEPLLRADLEAIAEHATAGGATVVVGTNGTLLSAERIGSLRSAGVQGVAVSVDSLNERYHDRFRHGDGALADTLAAVDRLAEGELDLVVQTTITRGNRAELPALAAWAAERGAVSLNIYFLVATGRAAGMDGLAPAENEAVLEEILALERAYRGRMMVRAKCQPQLMRLAYAARETAEDAVSPLLNYATRCPCGVHYCRVTPEGKLTPCPYTPVEAGDLRSQSFADVWKRSPVLAALRAGELGGRCGRCEYREVCGGCRARGFAVGGDLLAEDPACVYEPAGGPPVTPARTLTYGAAPAAPTLPWTDDARARMARVPGFVRAVVSQRVEGYARERGYASVTPDVLDEVRREMPVDFSKKLPFFLRRAAAGTGPGEDA
ncbi:MAG: radical SAM protein [Gemmatimonadota bacterium]